MIGDYFEKFLFYRGVGNFQLPLKLEVVSQQEYQLFNQGPDAIRSLFLVTIRGDKVRFTSYDQIDANSALVLASASQTSNVDDLAEAMTTALINEGLYRKEATAMVNSWRDSWFAEEGTRLLYMVPPRITDELLPLEISPKPDEVVRVLVGRMEIMSPEDEARVTELVQHSAKARQAELVNVNAGGQGGGAGRSRERGVAFDELVRMGRFAEPALVRVRHLSKDEAVRGEAAQLTAELRAQQQAP
jgi:hypothetical protein